MLHLGVGWRAYYYHVLRSRYDEMQPQAANTGLRPPAGGSIVIFLSSQVDIIIFIVLWRDQVRIIQMRLFQLWNVYQDLLETSRISYISISCAAAAAVVSAPVIWLRWWWWLLKCIQCIFWARLSIIKEFKFHWGRLIMISQREDNIYIKSNKE